MPDKCYTGSHGKKVKVFLITEIPERSIIRSCSIYKNAEDLIGDKGCFVEKRVFRRCCSVSADEAGIVEKNLGCPGLEPGTY